MRRIAKTASFGICHVLVAVALAFAITGSWAAAIAIGLLEPVVQALVFYLHDWAWESRAARSAAPAMP